MPNRIMVTAQIHTVLQIAPKCKKGVKEQEFMNGKTTTICTTAACSTPCFAAPVDARQLPKNRKQDKNRSIPQAEHSAYFGQRGAARYSINC